MASYLEFWGLRRSPFGGDQRAYCCPPVAESLARIEYLAQQRRRLGVLVAEPGLGASTLLQAAAKTLTQQAMVATVVDAALVSTRDLLWSLATGLGAQPRTGDDLPRLWRRLADRAAGLRWTSETCVLLIDHLEQATPDVLAAVVRLVQLAPAGAAWSTVLATKPRGLQAWPVPLREAVELRMELTAWEEFDTVDFVQQSLVDAGRLDAVFTEDALHRLHTASSGQPRLLTRLAELSLVVGAVEQCEVIEARLVDIALAEVNWTAGSPTAAAVV